MSNVYTPDILNVAFDCNREQHLNKQIMKFKTIYDACKHLMYEEEIPTKVIIGNKEMTIIVYGNGTYELIK